jgi:hypothetical protein
MEDRGAQREVDDIGISLIDSVDVSSMSRSGSVTVRASLGTGEGEVKAGIDMPGSVACGGTAHIGVSHGTGVREDPQTWLREIADCARLLSRHLGISTDPNAGSGEPPMRQRRIAAMVKASQAR